MSSLRVPASPTTVASPIEESKPLSSPTNPVTEIDPAESSFRNVPDNGIGFPASTSKTSFDNVTNVTEAAPGGAFRVSHQEIVQTLHQVESNLSLFVVPITEENKSQIFVLNEEGTHLELHENNLETDMVLEASHEAVKNYFVTQLSALYGKAVIDVLYPEEARKEPLTPAKAEELRKLVTEFQISVVNACNGDPKQYEPSLQSQLKALTRIKETIAAVANETSPLKPQVDSLGDYLSKQFGLSPETLSTCVLAGTAIGAVAATASGLALPVALHFLTTTGITAMAHGAGLHATASMTGASSLNMSSNISTAIPTIVTTAKVGATTVGVGAAGGAVAGLLAGAYDGFRNANPATGWLTVPIMTLAGIASGTTLGAGVGLGVAVMGPSTFGAITTIGGGALGFVGGALFESFAQGPSGGPGVVLLTATVGTALGGIAGGSVALYGGLCSLAAHAAITAI